MIELFEAFLKISAKDRSNLEDYWYNISLDYLECFNQAGNSRDNANNQEDYTYYEDIMQISLYKADYALNMLSLVSLQ